jgi:lipopolysaccharide transport system ATP-binding protein
MPAISIRNLGKRYRVNHAVERAPYRTLRDSLARAATAPLRRLRGEANGKSEEFWALKDVEFDVQPGEVVGIIGRNGAGKSTLLKILSRITKPTTGEVEINGLMGSLLEVGTGFHPELTGRENIFMNGSVLGMCRLQIERSFDAIVDFSGVEPFLDTPVKRYSSGMQVRLAFAVAAHLDPEILIIDEVLAVGDSHFQQKCLRKMGEVAREGRTVIFVSHSLPAVRSLTSTGVYLRAGRMMFYGKTRDAIEAYSADSSPVDSHMSPVSVDPYRRGAANEAPVRIRRIWLSGHESTHRLPTLQVDDDLTVCIELETQQPVAECCIAVTLIRDHDQLVATFFSPDVGFRTSLAPGASIVTCGISRIPFSPGKYSVTAGITQSADSRAYDVIVDYPLFTIELAEIRECCLDWTHRPWGALHPSDTRWTKTDRYL